MTIYDIDERIQQVLESAIDPDTGEIVNEKLMEELDALDSARDEKIENAALFSRTALQKLQQSNWKKQPLKTEG